MVFTLPQNQLSPFNTISKPPKTRSKPPQILPNPLKTTPKPIKAFPNHPKTAQTHATCPSVGVFQEHPGAFPSHEEAEAWLAKPAVPPRKHPVYAVKEPPLRLGSVAVVHNSFGARQTQPSKEAGGGGIGR